MERIVPLGYSGKETTLRNFIRSIRPPRSVQVAVRRYETKPGEQLQFDWGILPFVNKDGKNANLPCFVATLSYSRRRYIRFADSMDIYGLITCVIEAFRYFGGLTNAVLRDHMKTVVIGGSQKEGWNYNQQFLDLCRYLGVSIRLCQPRRAQTKMSELLSSQCEQSLATSPHIVYCILYQLYNTLSDAIFTAIFLIMPGNGVYYQDRRIYAQVT